MAEQIKKKEESQNLFASLPVAVCGSFVYPGMKTFLPVDTRQMKDLLHVVTASRDPQLARKFIIVREYTDMRGFMMFVR